MQKRFDTCSELNTEFERMKAMIMTIQGKININLQQNLTEREIQTIIVNGTGHLNQY